jgi:hypothetical protein
MEWENQGNLYGVKTIAYSFGNHVQYGKNQCKLSQEQLNEGYEKCKIASETLKRPWKYIENKPYVKNLLARNWFQVKGAHSIFAVGKFVKGSKTLVDGGTGWAVQMAIDNKKSVFFFEQIENRWYDYDNIVKTFMVFHHIPTLTTNFAGIGTREINENGKRAIKEVSEKTFNPAS